MSLTHKTIPRWACGFDFGFAITLFGYQIGFSFDLTEWHLMAEHYEGIGYLICVGPIALDILDATKYNPPVGEEEQLKEKLILTQNALEQDQMRLSACGLTAQGGMNLLDPVNPIYSSAQEHVAELFEKYTQALKEIEKLRKKQGGTNVKGKSLSTGKSRRKS